MRKRPHKKEDSFQQQREQQQPQTTSRDVAIDNGTHLLPDDTSNEPPEEDNDAASSAYDGYVIVQPSGHVSAVAAWNHKFGDQRHVDLTKDDRGLFTAGRVLGRGGFGTVYETFIDGISVALKRTYTRRLTPRQLNEIKILGRISEKRHRHIVDLVGSYTHQQERFIEIGLLIWPVACTDLSELLQNFWVFSRHYSSYLESGATEPNHCLQTAMEPLMTLLLPKAPLSPTSSCAPLMLLKAYKSRLRTSIGCIAEAVADLHRRGIRHKDLKPSQILLSPNGLWLTDFGWSMDMTEFPQSTTDGGDNITLKYQAPERANKGQCGRPEDIFALGCIFLEIAHTLVTRNSHVKFVRPWSQKGWVFQANLQHRQRWLDPLIYDLPYPLGFRLNNLIEKMLAYAARDRPRIDTVVKKIKNIQNSDYGSPFACPCYFLPQTTANASDP
jgi:serine/threonine protein kinase